MVLKMSFKEENGSSEEGQEARRVRGKKGREGERQRGEEGGKE